MRSESRGSYVHDILKANCSVFFVKLKTLYMHISICVCLHEEGERCGTIEASLWRKWEEGNEKEN